jgi:hypothetical protein
MEKKKLAIKLIYQMHIVARLELYSFFFIFLEFLSKIDLNKFLFNFEH